MLYMQEVFRKPISKLLIELTDHGIVFVLPVTHRGLAVWPSKKAYKAGESPEQFIAHGMQVESGGSLSEDWMESWERTSPGSLEEIEHRERFTWTVHSILFASYPVTSLEDKYLQLQTLVADNEGVEYLQDILVETRKTLQTWGREVEEARRAEKARLTKVAEEKRVKEVFAKVLLCVDAWMDGEFPPNFKQSESERNGHNDRIWNHNRDVRDAIDRGYSSAIDRGEMPDYIEPGLKLIRANSDPRTHAWIQYVKEILGNLIPPDRAQLLLCYFDAQELADKVLALRKEKANVEQEIRNLEAFGKRYEKLKGDI